MVGLFGFATPTALATGYSGGSTINFQGRLLSNAGAVVADGTYNVEFKIYTGGDGKLAGDIIDGANPAGTLEWTEDWVYGPGSGAGWVDNRVIVKNGYFSVNLGQICPFEATTCTANNGNPQTNSLVNFNSTPLWLSMNVSTNLGLLSTFSSGDGELLPMDQMASSVYAQNSNELGGLTTGQYVQLAQGVQTDSVTTNPAIGINEASGVTQNLITLQNNSVDEFDVTSAGNLTLGNNAAKTISVTTASSGAGGSLTVQAATGAAGTNAGGNLVLQGGASTGGAAGGDVIVKDQTDSSGAFQIQNAASNVGLQVDTSSVNYLTNPSFEGLSAAGWSLVGGGTGGAISSVNTQVHDGYGYDALDIHIGTTPASPSGASTSSLTTALSSGTYELSFFAKGSVSETDLQAQVNGVACTLKDISGNTTTNLGTGWAEYRCNVTAVAPTSIAIEESAPAGAAHDIYVDAVDLQSGSTASPFVNASRTSLDGSLLVNGDYLQAQSSTVALQVNALAGGGGLKLVGNGDNNLFESPTLAVTTSGGSNLLSVNDALQQTNVSGGNVLFAAFKITPSNASTVGENIAGFSGQTANLLQLSTAGGTVLDRFDGQGNLSSYGTNNSLLGLASPSVPTQTVTGAGTIASPVCYAVTATNSQGETVATSAAGTVSPGGIHAVVVAWSQVNGATGYKVYRNTSCAFTSGSLLLTTIADSQLTGTGAYGTVTAPSYTDSSGSTGAGLPPTAPTGSGLVLQGWSGQTAYLLQAENAASSNEFTVDPSGNGVFTGGLTSTGTINLNNSGSGTTNIGGASAGAIGIQSSAAITIQGNASSDLTFTNGTGTTELSVVAPSTSGTVNFQLPAGGSSGNHAICTDLGNCPNTSSKSVTKIVAMGSTACATPASVTSGDVAAADYTASGCSAQTAINSAISALPASGGIVYLEEGTYIISGSINIPSNVTLEGAGQDTIIELENGINANLYAITNTANTTNDEVTNMQILGNAANNTSGTQYGITGDGSTYNFGSGSGTSAVPGITIQNVTINNFRTAAVYLFFGTNSIISNSTFVNDNTVGSGQAIFIDGSNDNVTGNIIEGSGGYGINVSASNASVTGNTIEGSTSWGLYSNAAGNTISGNTVETNGNGVDLFANGAVLTGNTISNNTGYGVELGIVYDCLVTGNSVMSNSNYGIFLSTSSRNTITGNIVSSNSSDGIELQNSSNNVVSGNKLNSNTTNGIDVEVPISTSTANNITGNDIVQAAGNAIKVAASVTNTYLSDNTFSGGAGLSDSGTLTVYGNQENTAGNLLTTAPGGTVAGTAGSSVALQGGAGTTTTTGSDGGAVTLQAGTAGGSANNTGGGITLTGGTGVNTGSGGTVTLQGGAGGATSGANGGNLLLQGGTGTGAGSPGSVIVKPPANGANSFQVQNAAGTTLLNADTSTTLNLLPENASNFETGNAWTAKGVPVSGPAQSNTEAFMGTESIKIQSSAGSGGTGGQYTYAFTNGTWYVLSLYIFGNTNFSTINIGHVDSGSDVDCLTAQAVVSGGWTRYSCTFQAATTTSFYVKDTSTSHTWWIDGVQLETGSNASSTASVYNVGGQLQVNGVVSSPLAVKNTANSTTALTVDNAAGIQVLNVDTTNGRVVVGSGSSNAKLYVTTGTNNTGGNDTLRVNQGGGANALDLVDSGTATSLFSQEGSISLGVNSGIAGAGTVSATGSSATVTGSGTAFREDFKAGDTLTFADTTTCTVLSVTDETHLTCTANPSVETSVTYTLTGSGVSDKILLNANGQVGIGVDKGAATLTNTLTVAGTALFENTANTTSAFQVQNAAGDSVLNVSTSAIDANLISNPSFENLSTTGWATLGVGTVVPTSVTYPTVNFYASSGNDELDANITSVGAGAGVKTSTFTTGSTLPTGGSYTLSFMARTDSAGTLSIQAGYNATSCLTSTVAIPGANASNDWQYYTCTFTPGATVTSIWIDANAAFTGNLYIDSVQLESSPIPTLNAPTAVNGGSLATGVALSYVITALGVPSESLPSTFRTITPSGTNLTDGLSWPAVAGATGYRIYRSPGSTFVAANCVPTGDCLLTTITSGATTSFNDTGALSMQGYSPPTSVLPTPYRDGTASLDGSLVVNGGQQSALQRFPGSYSQGGPGTANTNQYETSWALQVNSLSDGSGEIIQGNQSDSLLQNLFEVDDGYGNQLERVAGANDESIFDGGSYYFYTPAVEVQALATNAPALNVQGAAGQTSDVLRVIDSNGNGVLTVGSTTTNLIKNSNFDGSNITFASTGWSAKGGSSIIPDTTTGFESYDSMKVTTTASGQGASTTGFTGSILPTTNYQLTFFAKCDVNTTLTAGHTDNGADSGNILNNSVCTNTWTQFTGNYVTGGTIGASPAVFIEDNSATNPTHMWIDGVSLVQTATNAATNYSPGNIYMQGVVSSPAVFENQGNSTQGFQVQNSTASPLLTVDTADGVTNFTGLAANDVSTIGANLDLGDSFPTGSGWTGSGTTGVGAVATHAAAGGVTAEPFSPTVTPTIGDYYEVTYTLAYTSGAGVFASLGGINGATISSSETYTQVIKATSAAVLTFTPAATSFAGAISSVTITQVTPTGAELAIQSSAGVNRLEVRSGGTNSNDTFVGLGAGQLNNTGSSDTAFGNLALEYNVSGSFNTAIGSSAMLQNTTGGDNVAVGPNSLDQNTSGVANVALGMSALGINQTGTDNVAIGYEAAGSITTGSDDAALGYEAGFHDVTDTSFATGAALQNATAIGAYAQVQESNAIVLGSEDNLTNVGIGTTEPLNVLSVSPVHLNSNTTTATQSATTTITASAGIFVPANVGEELIWTDGTEETITAYQSATVVLGSNAAITETTSKFRTQYMGLQVTSAGKVGIGTSAPAQALDVSNGMAQIDNDSLNFTQVSAPVSAPTLAAGGGTGLTGQYYYVVEYVTAGGQTNYGTVSAQSGVLANTGMTLTAIPTGPAGVLGRKIYRTIGGGPSTGPFYLVNSGTCVLTTDNVTTTCLDNVPDGSLGAAANDINLSDGTTGQISVGGVGILEVDATAVSSGNIGVGTHILTNNSTGGENVALGDYNLTANTIGSYNTALGYDALNADTTSVFNTAVGGNDGEYLQSGSYNTIVGGDDLYDSSAISGSDNTIVGGFNVSQLAGMSVNGGSNIILGYGNYTSGVAETLTGDLVIANSVASSAATSTDYLNIGNTLFGNTSTGTAYFQNSTNSANAFQVNNASGAPVINVDTTQINLLINPGFETTTSNPTGLLDWTADPGTGGNSIAQNVTKGNLWKGRGSLAVTLPATAADGAEITAANYGGTLTSGHTFELSFYAMASLNTIVLSTTAGGFSGGTCTLNSTALSTSGFQHYTCTDTTTGATSSPITITVSSAVAGTLYIDGVSLIDTTVSGTGYAGDSEDGFIQMQGIIDSPVTIQPQTSSTNAFQIYSPTGTGILTVDTLDSRVTIGVGATGESTPVIVVLDSGTSAADPTGITGAMYYNSPQHEYRCYTEAEWEPCRTQPIDQSYEIDEEFLSGSTAVSGTGIGNNNWTSNTMTTACTAITYSGSAGVPVTSSRPGILNIATPASATDGCALALSSLGTASTMVVGAGEDIKTSVAVSADTNPTVLLRVGLGNSLGIAQPTTGGVWWESDPNNSLFWRYCYDSSTNVATCASSGVGLSVNTFVHLEIQVVSATVVNFYIGGTKFTPAGVTLATSAVAPVITCGNDVANAAAHNCYVDYYQLRSDDAALR